MIGTRRYWLSAAIIAVVAVVVCCPAIAGKPEKPPKDDGETSSGTIYIIFNGDHNAPLEPEIVLGMNPDGSGLFQALPDDYVGQPSRRIYGADDHRWWLSVWPIPEEYYLNGSQRHEVFAFRPDSESPDGVRAVQLTDLFHPLDPSQAPIKPAPCTWHWALWSNDLSDTFISFKGTDFDDGDSKCVFRVPLTGDMVEAMDIEGAPPLIGRESLEVVLRLPGDDLGSYGQYAWSPDGNSLAYIYSCPPVDGFSNFLYVKSADSEGYFTPDDPGTLIWAGDYTWARMLDWSPDGSRIAFNGKTPDMGHYNLWTLAPDGTVLSQSDPYYSYGMPRWSPDGRYMALNVIKRDNSYKSGSYWLRDVGRVNQGGTGVRVLTADIEPRSLYKYPLAWVP